jgi:hypothetical protein
VRYRHVVKDKTHYYLLTNEGKEAVSSTPSFSVRGRMRLIHPLTCREEAYAPGQALHLDVADAVVIAIL